VLLEYSPEVQRMQSKQQKGSPLRETLRVPAGQGLLHMDTGTWKKCNFNVTEMLDFAIHILIILVYLALFLVSFIVARSVRLTWKVNQSAADKSTIGLLCFTIKCSPWEWHGLAAELTGGIWGRWVRFTKRLKSVPSMTLRRPSEGS